MTVLELLREQAQVCAIPEQYLHKIGLAAAEGEQVPAERILFEDTPHQTSIASPSMPLRMSITPSARCTFIPAGAIIMMRLPQAG